MHKRSCTDAPTETCPATDRSVPSRPVVKKSTPVGRECALVLPAASGQALELSYWDLWFALVADADFEGSWERFVEHLRLQKNPGGSSRLAERKLSHLRELERRLWQADVTISAIVAQVDQFPSSYDGLATGSFTREPREYEWSDAMRHTPRQRQYAYALRGFWPCFPVFTRLLCRTPRLTVPRNWRRRRPVSGRAGWGASHPSGHASRGGWRPWRPRRQAPPRP